MRSICKIGAALLLACPFGRPDPTRGQDLLPGAALDRLGVQRYWHAAVPLPAGEHIHRAILLDENLYLISDGNLAYAVHAMTGILRWTTLAAEPGQTVRGPTHSENHVFFTAPGEVKVLKRRTGELAGEPRKLRGVIIGVSHDIATISIGKAHGVSAEDVLDVVRVGEAGELQDKVIAKLRVTVVRQRRSKGRLLRRSRSTKVEPGYRVAADVVLPLQSVKLPFAASSPAVADDKNLYVGAANQRFYSLNIRTGLRTWQFMTPKTVSATPVMRDGNLYFGELGGRIVSCTRADRVKNWVFQTEGPIFADLVVEGDRVFAVSNDRLLYCLDRRSGQVLWRKRFDNAPAMPPALAGGRVYQQVPKEGLFVLEAGDGRELWRRPEGGRLLAEFEGDAYLFHDPDPAALIRVDAATGREAARVDASFADLAVAGQDEQLIILVSQRGQMMCLRPAGAPRLRPADLAAALRDDAKMGVRQGLAVEAKAEGRAAAAPGIEARSKLRLDFLEDEDWLGSRSTARPVGGSGLIEVSEPPLRRGGEEAEASIDGEDDEEEDLDEFDDEDEDDEGDEGDDEDDEDEGDEGDDEEEDGGEDDERF